MVLIEYGRMYPQRLKYPASAIGKSHFFACKHQLAVAELLVAWSLPLQEVKKPWKLEQQQQTEQQ